MPHEFRDSAEARKPGTKAGKSTSRRSRRLDPCGSSKGDRQLFSAEIGKRKKVASPRILCASCINIVESLRGCANFPVAPSPDTAGINRQDAKAPSSEGKDNVLTKQFTIFFKALAFLRFHSGRTLEDSLALTFYIGWVQYFNPIAILYHDR